MDRKTIDITLPESGLIVTIVEFLTYGEQKEIKKAMTKDATQEVVDGRMHVNFSGDVNMRIISELIKVFVKKIADKDGTEFEINGSPNTAEKILDDNITERDGDVLELAIGNRVAFIKKNLNSMTTT